MPIPSIEDLFSLHDIQAVQDRFADATGVASIITHPDGRPITTPSRFCRLCKDIIRCTDKGRENCYQSDTIIGRLAGGVAHDRNSMLSLILGYGELLMADLEDDPRKNERFRQVVQAGHRAPDLVGHLLAFSPRQTLAYSRLNLNQTLERFEKLLRRTIREDIEIILIPTVDSRPVRGDAGQIDQVILNLCVNAQDAMPDGGRLTIETGLVDLDARYGVRVFYMSGYTDDVIAHKGVLDEGIHFI